MGGVCCKKTSVSDVDEAAHRQGRAAGSRPTVEMLRKRWAPSAFENGVLGDGADAVSSFTSTAAASATLASDEACYRVLESRSVLVGVRIRPGIAREATTKQCIICDGPTSLQLTGPSPRPFNFDVICRPEVGQQDVYARFGRPLLLKALNGYNACLFAYGQTGSGKTYTMLGQGDAAGDGAGIIPRFVADLFAEVGARHADGCTVSVSCSVLEIYNEKLHDLLGDRDSPRDLTIREEVGGRGVFVDGLVELTVESATSVDELISEALQRRAVGRTNMNEHSSRSHAVISFSVTSCDADDADGLTRKWSKISLVDLAGSERAKATGATGSRLKEGAQINLSLSALGNVINALTEVARPRQSLNDQAAACTADAEAVRASAGARASTGGRASTGTRPSAGVRTSAANERHSTTVNVKRHVPYRDSKLTRLLQDSLGGNSFTAIVCNISPAEESRDETLGVLRFAERAKKVENVAKVNVDPKAARIAELADQNKALLAKVKRLEGHVADLEKYY